MQFGLGSRHAVREAGILSAWGPMPGAPIMGHSDHDYEHGDEERDSTWYDPQSFARFCVDLLPPPVLGLGQSAWRAHIPTSH